MPYSGPNDSKLPDNVKALSAEKRSQWVGAWNSAYARCQENDGEDCEGAAFRMANGVVFEEAEIFTPPSRLGINGRLSVIELRALSKDDTKAAKWAQGILDKLSEAAMSEQESTNDVTEMSDVEVMSYTPMGATSFVDLRTAEQADVAANEVHRLTYQFQSLVSNIMSDPTIEVKSDAIEALAGEFVMLIRETLGDAMTEEGEQLSEFDAPGLAVEVARDATEADLSEAGVETAENGRRAPVIVDFRILNPGPGNKRQNRYYPADVLKRDIGVFEGATVFVTDHREKERSERTKVGKVIQCPIAFLENGAPIGRVLIYDPDQAEKARNRHDAGALDTLECSIFGRGRGRDGKIDGQKYKIIESITEGVFLELVSKGGAGGQAESLAESSEGVMENEQEQTQTEPTQVEEVEITENQEESAPETEPVTMLEADAVQAALDKTRLPDTFKRVLALAEYESEDALQEAVDQAIAEVKSLTGSGQPFAQGASESTESAPDFDTIEAEHTDRINEILAEVGIRS